MRRERHLRTTTPQQASTEPQADAGTTSPTSAALAAAIRYDWPIQQRHGKASRYATRLGLTVPQLRARVAATDFPSNTSWHRISDETMRVLLEAFDASGENLTQFASRHGYSSASLGGALRDRFGTEYQAIVDRKAIAPGNRYRLGADLERRAVRALRERGFYVVRSPASAGAADLVAMRPEVDLLVQCKRGGILPRAEWNELVTAAETAGALPVLVENPHRGQTNWWHLVGHRAPGTGGDKRPLTEAMRELATPRTTTTRPDP